MSSTRRLCVTSPPRGAVRRTGSGGHADASPPSTLGETLLPALARVALARLPFLRAHECEL
jgi:hypothetical protein